jgi:signal transduction histidine kinase
LASARSASCRHVSAISGERRLARRSGSNRTFLTHFLFRLTGLILSKSWAIFLKTPRDTRLRASASRQAGIPAGVSIAIEDDGRGIAPLARSTALERGVRLDQREGGTGLGLAIVQDLLDAYGWQLDLASSELGGLKATIASRSASIQPNKTGLDIAASKVLPTNLTPR